MCRHQQCAATQDIDTGSVSPSMGRTDSFPVRGYRAQCADWFGSKHPPTEQQELQKAASVPPTKEEANYAGCIKNGSTLGFNGLRTVCRKCSPVDTDQVGSGSVGKHPDPEPTWPLRTLSLHASVNTAAFISPSLMPVSQSTTESAWPAVSTPARSRLLDSRAIPHLHRHRVALSLPHPHQPRHMHMLHSSHAL
ncbi:hypothetical protein DFH11DRAFT_310273 [Phellopilus nigrolimitatus]|nr:hypothetical protein DFH11DRAFT_310273 [Phellopilus nigrolimitatus]